MISLSRPIQFFDDRAKTRDTLRTVNVLWQENELALVRVLDADDTSHTILFDRRSGEVLTNNFEFWIAENYL